MPSTSRAIEKSGAVARKFNAAPDEEDDIRLEFTFDSRLESNGTAGLLYTALGRVQHGKLAHNMANWDERQ